ncbi:MAG: DNA/RNA non-specific endonuclease [Acutalibacteraceae bacterium]|nr:DNA/RNA non-specific endonuclease [Acutalibacteraceae bacterium]
MNKFFKFSLLSFILVLTLLFTACSSDTPPYDNDSNRLQEYSFSISDIPEFDGETAYIVINNNIPSFEQSELVSESYEQYAPLDALERCGVAMACIGKDIMPTEERGNIGQVKPSGWHTVKYDNVDGKYLYNRCHLIGYQLTGENANEQNLITGTRYLNIEGMLPFENMIADYVKETDNHVIYRVTPIFENDNLLASGVQMEAFSVEDDGEGICFNVYAYNAQPDILIDYKTGESSYNNSSSVINNSSNSDTAYILNTNSKKIHLPSCKYANDIKPENRKSSAEAIDKLISMGYSSCKNCNP